MLDHCSCTEIAALVVPEAGTARTEGLQLVRVFELSRPKQKDEKPSKLIQNTDPSMAFEIWLLLLLFVNMAQEMEEGRDCILGKHSTKLQPSPLIIL